MRSLVLSLIAVAALAATAVAQEPNTTVTFPVIGTETPRGTGKTVALPAATPAAKTVDGSIADWTGSGPGFAGTVVRSKGELVYTDHLFDAYGADDGRDAERLQNYDGPMQDAVPETYRLEALNQQDPAGQFGAPVPDELRYSANYGDLGRTDAADLSEVRLAADANGGLLMLARTTTMNDSERPSLLVLLDTESGDTQRDTPFGLQTTKAEYAAVITGATGTLTDLRTDEQTTFTAATNADGWTNAVETRIPVEGVDAIAVGAAKAGADQLANVAFRTAEPVRENFDKQQALALHAKTIDPFFQAVDTAALRAGADERWEPGPGYHEAQFRSSEPLSRESGQEGILQPYGVYFPESYDAAKETPLQLWLHWRGGTAHSAAAATPGVFRDMGEREDSIVVSPRGRGTSSWYVGRGHLDILEVWSDIHRRFKLDEQRRYVSGHSMGGFGSFLLSVTHPDWFAAALPASPPVTQGAWTGADFEGCDEMRFDDYSPCYIQANDGDARAQHHRRLLENLRHTPVAIYHGTADELVPTSGVTRQVERLMQLGYRHRYYLFHTQEHFGPPIWDQWGEGSRYMRQFTIPEKPARISHVRDMPFERATERVNSGGLTLDFDFGRNHWLLGLEPADAETGRATFEGTTKAVPATEPITVPEAGGPTGIDNAGPYTMTGLKWETNPLAALPAKANAFEATLGAARSAKLDMAGMGIDTARAVSGKVTTDTALELVLAGKWKGAAHKRATGSPGVTFTKIDDALVVRLPAGRTSEFTIAAA